ncbi:hypothetical protein TH30_03050 [Thalassospira profundimaris]|uniref:Lantibiotic biosynthesis protein dehydration domain-containing protein n=2 Tax=Thalassospira profundimaris TaxID=502049 RepID=A0A367X950_9PROT|nr:hypothetical protein TH30_03050 [Thalassospira profundimaris]
MFHKTFLAGHLDLSLNYQGVKSRKGQGELMETDPFWTTIVARAATIDERLSGKYVPVPADNSMTDGSSVTTDQTQAEYLKRWCEFASNGDHDLFTRRLARDGLSERDVTPFLGNVRLRDGEALPDWVPTAIWFLDAMMAGGQGTDTECPSDIAETVPFADLIWPAVVQAQRMLGDRAPSPLTLQAQDDLTLGLVSRLSKFAEGAFFESFTSYRQAVGIAPDQAAGTGVYGAFKTALCSGPLRNLIAARPVLIRILATVTDHWIGATREFLERLENDLPALAGQFPELADARKVAKITAGISDPHNHGRTVLILTFENDAKIVYKPRPVDAECAWKELSDWFEKAGSDIRLCAPKTWARDGYGWMGFVKANADLSQDQGSGFYRAAGQLLALMYCLKGSDMHHENFLIADGRPVVIDLETLFQPELRLFYGADHALHAKELAQHRLDGGVNAVGLLPKRKNIAGHWIDDGGLAVAQTCMVKVPTLRHINQDQMVLDQVEREELLSGIALTIGGKAPDIADFLDDVLSGFDDAVAFLSAHKDELVASDGPLAAFAGATIRHVLRPTAYYQELERASRQPQNQQDGFVWSLNFERLCRKARWDLENYPGWALLGAERTALARLDVPLFTGKTDQDGIWADGRFLTDQLTQRSVLPTIETRIDLVTGNAAQERAIIRQSFLATSQAFLPSRRPWQNDKTVENIKDVARTKAFQIADIVASQAIMMDGSASWITADITGDGKGLEARVMDEGLYGGTAGQALFFAECYGVDPVGKWRDLAVATLEAPRQMALGNASTMPRPVTAIGGFEGVAGLVYVLTRCADLLEMPDLLEDAVRLCARLDDQAIASDKALDVISGSAGAILVLLALYDATGNSGVLERAVRCGRHFPENPTMWKSVSSTTLAGMSHGAAGVVYALLKLYQATGDKAFLDLANSGLAYERGLFDPDLKGWPDLRDDANRVDPVQWCHGAVGIGFARMATLHILDDPMIRAEIDMAIAATLSVPDGGRDNLCCGHAGRFSMLAYAMDMGLGPDNLETVFNQRLLAWISRLDSGQIGLAASDVMLQHGLMQGLSGIGQALLEIGSPPKVRPVLLLA